MKEENEKNDPWFGLLLVVVFIFAIVGVFFTVKGGYSMYAQSHSTPMKSYTIISNKSAYDLAVNKIDKEAKKSATAVCKSKGFDVGYIEIEYHSAKLQSTEDYYVASTTANAVCGYSIPDPSIEVYQSIKYESWGYNCTEGNETGDYSNCKPYK